jgi:biofilm PGA synthesis N-glycosyltransferase PgaC
MAAYRKSALIDCGLFDSNTVTEDIDITWKLQKNFWDIRYEPHALSWILVPETLTGLWHQRVRWAQGGVEVLKKHVNVLFHFKYRRLWPLYLEYFTGVLWAHCFIFLVLLWLIFLLIHNFCYFYLLTFCPAAIEIDTNITSFYNPLLPRWYGAILGLACLLEFFTSFLIDTRYEKKSFFKYYFWVVWYPVAYWIISALAAINGFFNVIFRRKGISSIWISPDRGLQALK